MKSRIGPLGDAILPDTLVVDRSRWAWIASGAALAAVYLPYLYTYADQMMLVREHYQFLPLAWLGALVLAWSRRKDLRTASPLTRPIWGWVGLGIGAILLVAAGVIVSPWLAMASVPVTILGLGWLWGGPVVVRALFPSLILFLTTLRPPGMIDLILIQNLRTIAVRGAGRVLDGLGVLYVPLSNVLRVSGGDLLVDEACSGVNSLVSIMAVVLFLGLLLRRGPVHLGLLLAWSAVVVILANIGRVTIVTVAFARYQIDLVHGWRHEALGVALYAISLGLVASMEQLLFLFEPLFRLRSRRPPASDPAWAAPRVDQKRGPTRLGPGSILILSGVFGSIALILPARWAQGIRPPQAGLAEMDRVIRHNRPALNEASLPAELAGWQRVGYKTEERQREDVFGQYSSIWEYRLGARTAQICVDYPFVGWHELLACYSSINWTTRQRKVERADLDETKRPTAPYIAATLDSGTGEHATLRFALIDDADQWVEPPPDAGLGLIGRDLPWDAVAPRALSQVQLFSSGYRPANEEELAQQDRLFQAACHELKHRISLAGSIEP